MILDILKVYGYDEPSYMTETDQNVYWFSLDQFWVIDTSVAPVFRLVGPFSSIEEAQKCAKRIEVEYQKLIRKEIDLAAFKAFLEQENTERECVMRASRQADLASYTPTASPQKKSTLEP
ncbi:hypothetical protein HKD21_11595 [Gluconobacter cerevisiae]|uniref:Uncharacterized protein n=2 Tax=Gluconobacter TaxID=441 RepID=A0ABR9YGM0_9PROT|nr:MULTISPECIES: hypothetical protein [Gluconobacter]MBF0877487.1 hypothetical protein [Gluconobacter cerevisiae]GBR28988.1 hypothetical protein AA3266_0006 [Gluconobacter kondonii NBRC 3266]GLQ66061.1 hypothetical protein GCM10007870_16450 [Gluconobacter kondonii]